MKHLLRLFHVPFGRQRAEPRGAFRQLKVALIADELTRSCLAFECQIRDVTPLNFKVVLKMWRPDLLFVESAWHGIADTWKFKIAAYPDYPQRNNFSLRQVVTYARDLGIRCVFWNKEDGVHFERFIKSAGLFDTVFTVDENCVPRYREMLGSNAQVQSLMFAVQPAIHSPSDTDPVHPTTCFVGSYSHHIHDRRRQWQDMMFRSAENIGVTVFDRNSSRRSVNYRYPELPWLEIRKSVSHERTAEIYRNYLASFNVNTVEDSPTMFSRRLIEILACGGLAITNPATSVDRWFRDYCEVVRSEDECRELLGRLRHGLTPRDRERVRAGADYVLRKHTWAHRLEEVMQVIA